MKKVFVAYDSKHGNTKIAAENILEGIKDGNEVETALGYVKEIDPEILVDYDGIILGAPNHMGRPSRTMKMFIEKLGKFELKAKNVAVFGTYSGRERPVDRAVRKLEKLVERKLPTSKLMLPGLSIKVNGIPGPIVEGELPKCLEFGRKIADQLVGK